MLIDREWVSLMHCKLDFLFKILPHKFEMDLRTQSTKFWQNILEKIKVIMNNLAYFPSNELFQVFL